MDFVAAPTRGVLSQGYIFSCATAQGYEGCDVAGLVITARCDTINDKVDLYNFVPVVSLADWLYRGFRVLLCRRIVSQNLNNLAQRLKQAGYDPGVLQTEDPITVCDALFSAKTEATKTQREKALGEAKGVERARRNEYTQCDDWLDILRDNRKGAERALSELLSHNLTGYYYIPSIDPREHDGVGYVALLRQVGTLPKEIANEIVTGITPSRARAILGDQVPNAAILDIESEQSAIPVGRIVSPYIEHLMQTFGNLFVRIGVQETAANAGDLIDRVIGEL